MVITVPEHKKSEIIMYTFVTVIRTHGSEISWWSVIVLFLLSEGNESITSSCLLVTILCKHDYSSLIITEAVGQCHENTALDKSNCSGGEPTKSMGNWV